MKIIETLKNQENTIDIVQIKDKKFIRVTSTNQAVWNEKAFIETLKQYSIPTLSFFSHKLLGPNQFMRTYAEKAYTLAERHVPYDFFQLGKLLRRIHSITFPTCLRITPTGKEESIQWSIFIEGELQYKRPDLSTKELQLAHDILNSIRVERPVKPSLLHGHVTMENCLKLNNSIILIDKNPAIFAGDPLYDLGWIYTYFTQLFFLDTQGQNVQDREAHKAFVEGYGCYPLQIHGEKLERYVLLHHLTATPEEVSPEIIRKLLQRLS